MNNYPIIAKRQSGVVLVISLIMLLALTLIGVTSSNVTGLEEKMAANTQDINLAFQAAEATLRSVEASLSTKPTFDYTNTNQGVNGRYTLVDANGTLQWSAFYPSINWIDTSTNDTACSNATTTTAKVGVYTGSSLGGRLCHAPRYIIEEINSASTASTGSGSLEAGTPIAGTPGEIVTFRITAHGWGGNQNTVVNVQSVVKVTY